MPTMHPDRGIGWWVETVVWGLLVGIPVAAVGCRTTNTTVYMCPNANLKESKQTSSVPATTDLGKKVEIAREAKADVTP